jgi:hypothetical protein
VTLAPLYYSPREKDRLCKNITVSTGCRRTKLKYDLGRSLFEEPSCESDLQLGDKSHFRRD